MKKRIVYDSEIAGFAAMGTRQATNHERLVSVQREGQLMHWPRLLVMTTTRTHFSCPRRCSGSFRLACSSSRVFQIPTFGLTSGTFSSCLHTEDAT